jgi:hypothetical protein
MAKEIEKEDLEREHLLDDNAVPPSRTLPEHTAGERLDGGASLLKEEEIEQMRSHWQDIQADFVENPRTSVEEADHFLDELIGKIAEGFAGRRSTLARSWNDGEGDDLSTEKLRQVLQEYRTFFDRLTRIEF